MHLASKAFIEEICPTPSRYKKQSSKKPKHAVMDQEDDEEGEDDEDDDEDDEELAWLASLGSEAPAVEGKEVDDDMDYEPGDLLGKVLALVNQVGSFNFLCDIYLKFHRQVRASPQAKTFFGTMCVEEGLTPLELIKWIRTRWGSMYDLVDRVLLDRTVCFHFSNTSWMPLKGF